MAREHNFHQDDRAPALPVDLKHENRKKVLTAFQKGDECTVADISNQTGISRLTVMRAIQYFISRGVLRSVGLGESSNMGGKKPERFAFADKRLTLCIALWPYSTRLSLRTITGTPVAETDFPSDLHRSLDEVFEELAAHIDAFLQEKKISRSRLYGVMLSTAGTVDAQEGTLRYSVHSPEWGDCIPLRAYLEKIMGPLPALLVENAGKTAGRAVLLRQEEAHTGRVLTVFTAWGVSACMIEEGAILSGPLSLVGEIGHMSIDPADPELCPCGRHGCLERLVSPERLMQLLSEKPAPAGSPLADMGESFSYKLLFEAAQAGDARAMELTDHLARCYADALHNVAVVYNPDHVVFQGSVGHACSYFDTRLREAMSGFCYYPEGTAFHLTYDPTDLLTLNADGGWYMLNEHYFSDPALYQDE